jgi:ABC-type transport system involved in multi-copper enzyme maturation permease subunit
MNVRMNEFKKVFSSPIILGLLILFIVFNSITIFKSSYFKDDLKVLNEVVAKFGYKIDDEMVNRLKEYYEEQINRLNEITEKRTAKRYSSVSEFYKDNFHNMEDVYSEEEKMFIRNLGIIENYYYEIGQIDELYSNIDIIAKGEYEIKKYGLSGKAADTVRNQYREFNDRFHQLIRNGEHKNLFFMGKVYKMHSLLFKTIFKTIIFEIVILSVLITLYLINYEFDCNTEYIVYTTKRGRNLIIDKLCIAICSNLLVATIIIFTALSLYFTIFNYSGLWNVPISSYFNAEYSFPYMSWWNMSFKQYLFLSILVIYASMMLFTGIAFILARAIKNNYIGFFVFAIVFGLFLAVPNMIPRNTNLIFIGGFTPFFLIMNPNIWFMENEALVTFKYYELSTISIWTVLLLILSVLSVKRFKRQDI